MNSAPSIGLIELELAETQGMEDYLHFATSPPQGIHLGE